MIYNPTLKQVGDAVAGDFTSIHMDGDYAVFVDQSTQLIVAKVHFTDFLLQEPINANP
jgi:hypothetical protein